MPSKPDWEWDPEAKVTPMGSLVFFAQYAQTGGLLDRLCQDSPLAYSRHNDHTYFIGSLRVVLGVDVMPGKQASGKHSRPGL